MKLNDEYFPNALANRSRSLPHGPEWAVDVPIEVPVLEIGAAWCLVGSGLGCCALARFTLALDQPSASDGAT